MATVEFREVSLSRAGRPVLDRADWRLEAGELQVISGATGAGKSTLLAVAGLSLAPEGGEVALFAAPRPGPAEAPAARRRIGMAEQRPRFLEHLSVLENVAMPLRLAGVGPEARRAQAAELLDWLGLGERARHLPGALSGGERRRSALARAVIASPELILADEPSADLDREGCARALEMLAALASHGTAVAVASRDAELIRLARHHSDTTVLRLEGGRIARGEA